MISLKVHILVIGTHLAGHVSTTLGTVYLRESLTACISLDVPFYNRVHISRGISRE